MSFGLDLTSLGPSVAILAALGIAVIVNAHSAYAYQNKRRQCVNLAKDLFKIHFETISKIDEALPANYRKLFDSLAEHINDRKLAKQLGETLLNDPFPEPTSSFDLDGIRAEVISGMAIALKSGVLGMLYRWPETDGMGAQLSAKWDLVPSQSRSDETLLSKINSSITINLWPSFNSAKVA